MNAFRRTAIALAVLLAVPALAGAQTTSPKVRVSINTVDVGGLSLYADVAGFFKKHGLDVEIVTLGGVGGGTSASAALAGGTLDFAGGNATTVALAHEHGLPFVLVAPSGAYSSASPTSALIVLKSGPIKSARDLVGKTVGVQALRTIGDVAVRAWLDKSGVSSNDVRFVEVPYSEMDAALVAGRVDAVMAEEPAVALITNADGRVLARPYDAIGSHWLEGGYFCTTQYLKAHPDVVRRFADAMSEAAAWANTHHAETAAILDSRAKHKLPPNAVRISFPPRVTPALEQPVLDASAKYGLLKAAFPASEIIAPESGG